MISLTIYDMCILYHIYANNMLLSRGVHKPWPCLGQFSFARAWLDCVFTLSRPGLILFSECFSAGWVWSSLFLGWPGTYFFSAYSSQARLFFWAEPRLDLILPSYLHRPKFSGLFLTHPVWKSLAHHNNFCEKCIYFIAIILQLKFSIY